MRTLIDIHDDLMEELLSESAAKTKRDAVITAIKSYISQKKREKLISLIDDYEFGYSAKDLEKMRSDE